MVGIEHPRFKATDGRAKFLAHDFLDIECRERIVESTAHFSIVSCLAIGKGERPPRLAKTKHLLETRGVTFHHVASPLIRHNFCWLGLKDSQTTKNN